MDSILTNLAPIIYMGAKLVNANLYQLVSLSLSPEIVLG